MKVPSLEKMQIYCHLPFGLSKSGFRLKIVTEPIFQVKSFSLGVNALFRYFHIEILAIASDTGYRSTHFVAMSAYRSEAQCERALMFHVLDYCNKIHPHS